MLPPTHAALVPHITPTNYIAMLAKSYTTNCPNLLPFDKNDWNADGEVYFLINV